MAKNQNYIDGGTKMSVQCPGCDNGYYPRLSQDGKRREIITCPDCGGPPGKLYARAEVERALNVLGMAIIADARDEDEVDELKDTIKEIMEGLK
jgi:hypothetical protein